MNTYHEIEGNLLDAHGCVICHQVNCKGVMGSGVALQIKQKWPEVYEAYKELCNDFGISLGRSQIVTANDGAVIVNMFAQYDYGTGKRFTDYEAFVKCLESLNRDLPAGASVAFPYKIGSDRGGANWEVIKAMICNILTDKNIYIYRLKGAK